MMDLPGKFDTSGPRARKLVDPTVFQLALEESFERFREIMKPIYDMRLNTRAGGRVAITIPEYQLASYITRLLIGRYKPLKFEQVAGWEEEWKKSLPKALRHHFLLDVMQQNWRGSGDSRLFNTVWHQDANEKLLADPTYTNPIDRESWEKLLPSWFEEQLRSAQKDRAPIRSVDKLVMRFIYMKIISVQENADKEYEIDHVIPVDRLRALIPTDDPGWPISNIANLTLLEKGDNRKKRTETLLEYIQRLASQGRHEQVESIRRLAISPVEICGIPTDKPADKAWFDEFLRERFQAIKSALLKAIDV